MFGTILISAATLMHLYLFWRILSVPYLERHVPRGVIVGAGFILWAILFLGRVIGHSGTGAAAATLEFLAMSWLGVLFLSFIPLLAVDLVTLFGLLLSRRAPSLRGGALLVGAVLSSIAFVQGLRPPVVNDYEVKLPGLPAALDGTVLVALSDLHLGSQIGDSWLAARIRQVQALQPDIVVLLGDIFEGHGPPADERLATFRQLSPRQGVWAVSGNHEFYAGGDMGLFAETRFKLLRNAWAEVRPGLVLAGVDDLTVARRSGQTGDLVAQALAGHPPGAVILLSHTPWQAEKAAAAGAGLMLSGHTHGGQIWPFGCLVERRYPLLGGRYGVDGMPVIVSRGTGTWGPRMRLWRPGEILRVTLRGKGGTSAAGGPRPHSSKAGLDSRKQSSSGPLAKKNLKPVRFWSRIIQRRRGVQPVHTAGEGTPRGAVFMPTADRLGCSQDDIDLTGQAGGGALSLLLLRKQTASDCGGNPDAGGSFLEHAFDIIV